MKTEDSPSPDAVGPGSSEAVQARDAGVRLVARLNRWVVAGAVALASALSVLTAHAYHARAAASRSATRVARGSAPSGARSRSRGPSASRTTSTDDSTAPAASAPQPPAAAPVPAAPVPAAPVVSGGS